MSPEQCRPDAGTPIGPPADVWGLGATLYHAIAGDHPFSTGDPTSPDPAGRWPQLVEDPEPLTGRVGESISQPILACLARDPKRRPTPAEIADRLELVLEALPRPKLSKLKPR
jgi:serine/threonine protein kinase